MMRGDYYICIYLANNEYGLILIVNRDWVNGELLELFEYIQDPVELTHEETRP